MKPLHLSMIATIGIVSVALVGIYITVNPIINQTSFAVVTPSFTSEILQKSCSSPQVLNGLTNLTEEQKQYAISLAEGSKIFQENTIGLNYSLASVAPNYSFNPNTCNDFKINAVTVGFKLGNGSSLAIYEDANLTKITGINIMHIMHDVK